MYDKFPSLNIKAANFNSWTKVFNNMFNIENG